MRIVETYLSSLRDKVFKLLPMRENYDAGQDNHIDEYVKNLYVNFEGAFYCYPELVDFKEMADAQANISFLNKTDIDEISFKRWRSIVLNTTNLIQKALQKCKEKEGA